MSDRNWPLEVREMMQRIPHGDDCATQSMSWRCGGCGEQSDYGNPCTCDHDERVAAVIAEAIQQGIVAAATLENAPAVLRTIDGGLRALKVLKQAQPGPRRVDG